MDGLSERLIATPEQGPAPAATEDGVGLAAPLGAVIAAASTRTRDAVTAVQVAGLAADAARRVPGVVALQPRLRHLPRHWTQRVWTQATGRPLPNTAGVSIRLHGSEHPSGAGVEVEIAVVTEGQAQATMVARAVQRAAAEAVVRTTGLPVHRVRVYICDIVIPRGPGTAPA